MANPFVHVELNTTDLSAAKAFYGKLFDWKMQDMPMPQGSYAMIEVGDIAAATQKAMSLGVAGCRGFRKRIS
ncbi:MAG: Glyoxalase/bleomycin resistance protein/dioxygenase [Herminiimonas sp.]|nr:Glyoxalase/bleomycin resistance protein/dioxygenase [Herminiimonas sp.]